VKTKTVPSIPHKNKTAPYLDQMQQEDEEEVQENRYNARPPVERPVNKDLAPTSYNPKVDLTKGSVATKCVDYFGKSKVERVPKWIEEAEKQDPNKDTKMRILNKIEKPVHKFKASP
jgi:hypothetical protein